MPLALAAEMVRLVPPELVNVSDKLELLPTCTLPNARLIGLAVSVPCATPAPERGMVKSELLPLEVMVTFPLVEPLALGANTTVNEVLWPAVNVNGKDRPLRLNPVPLAVAAEMVKLLPPLFVRVSVSDFDEPTVTLPKARLVGLGVKAPCATPVPESGMFRLGTEPVAVTFTLPLAAPDAVGEKRTVNEVLWPAVSVTGNDRPLKLNPVPLALAAEIVRLLPPELVSVPLRDFDVPSWTLPKLKLVGFDPKRPCATPVPDSGIERVGLPALELIVNVPLAAPAAAGVKIALKVALCPALMVAGKLGPVKLNPLPAAVALETVTAAPPVLLTVTAVL